MPHEAQVGSTAFPGARASLPAWSAAGLRPSAGWRPVPPGGPRPGEAAGAGLTMVRSQELQFGAIGEARRSLEGARASAVEALRRARDFVHRADWMRERFPDARLCDVEGLVKLVNRAEIDAHDWSLTPGGYVGVAPEEGEDFDFEEALRAIHMDIEKPNEDAEELAERISRSYEESGA